MARVVAAARETAMATRDKEVAKWLSQARARLRCRLLTARERGAQLAQVAVKIVSLPPQPRRSATAHTSFEKTSTMKLHLAGMTEYDRVVVRAVR